MLHFRRVTRLPLWSLSRQVSLTPAELEVLGDWINRLQASTDYSEEEINAIARIWVLAPTTDHESHSVAWELVKLRANAASPATVGDWMDANGFRKVAFEMTSGQPR
jgi:hypothetical protein